MRQIGTLDNAENARLFCEYLLTKGVTTRTDRNGSDWEIWVFDEHHVETARDAFLRFQENPAAEEFVVSAQAAEQLRQEQERRVAAALRQRRRNQPRQTRRNDPADLPVTLTLIVVSIIVTIAISLEETRFGLITDLSITSYAPAGLEHIQFMPGLPEIRGGQVWRLFTPIFTHFGPLHLLMNMIITYQFGTLLESYLRSWRFLLLVLFIAATSNLAQYYWSGPTFGGMSGVDFGLFGFLWINGHFNPASGMRLRQDFVYFMLGFMVLCFTGIIGPIANAAHVMGLVSGGLAAFLGILVGKSRH